MSERDIILTAVVLRAKGQFADAIQLLNDNWSLFSEDFLPVAIREKFYAAVEAGDRITAGKLAQKIAEEDPHLPSIQPYLR
ncbi:MAG: hypothetical protein IAE97_10920 [Chthoniobacterales bacterium]|nr:hypothetical protein [Chthoniobacterales bacterium]